MEPRNWVTAGDITREPVYQFSLAQKTLLDGVIFLSPAFVAYMCARKKLFITIYTCVNFFFCYRVRKKETVKQKGNWMEKRSGEQACGIIWHGCVEEQFTLARQMIPAYVLLRTEDSRKFCLT